MVELTTNQIIKITIGVIVLVFVIIAVSLSFRNYIIPYFNETFPDQRDVDLDTPYYQSLIKPENLVGVLQTLDQKKNLIDINESGVWNRSTGFYYWKKSGEIYHENKASLSNWFGKDTQVGQMDKNGIIRFENKYIKKYPILEKIHTGEKLGREIYLIP